MRTILPLLAVCLLAGCGKPVARQLEAGRQTASASDPVELVECASEGGAFERACTVERTDGEGGMTLVLRKPDGGFRRLLVTGDGRGVIAADGAAPAQIRPLGEKLIEVAIGDDRFRLPATVKPPA
ncbi:MAG: hypothetical protein ACM3YM_11515 [Sphingomonadales bacterium]